MLLNFLNTKQNVRRKWVAFHHVKAKIGIGKIPIRPIMLD